MYNIIVHVYIRAMRLGFMKIKKGVEGGVYVLMTKYLLETLAKKGKSLVPVFHNLTYVPFSTELLLWQSRIEKYIKR